MKAKRHELRDRDENYPEIHQGIAAFERLRAANRYVIMNTSFAHEQLFILASRKRRKIAKTNNSALHFVQTKTSILSVLRNIRKLPNFT